MIWIEIIGSGGIGKSYIFNELCKEHPKFQPYNNQSIVNNKILNFLPKQSTLFRRFSIRDINKRIDRFKLEYSESDENAIKVFFDSLPIFTDDPVVKLELCKYFSYRFREMKFFETHLKTSDFFLVEDGLIHLLISGINSTTIKEISKPDILISLSASLEYVSKNRKKRISLNRPSLIESRIPDAEFFNVFFPRNFRIYKEKTLILKEFYGKNFHEIDVEMESLPSVIEKINEAVTSFQRAQS